MYICIYVCASQNFTNMKAYVCMYKNMCLLFLSAKEAVSNDTTTCSRCHAKRLTLYEVPPERLIVPLIIYADFEKVG